MLYFRPTNSVSSRADRPSQGKAANTYTGFGALKTFNTKPILFIANSIDLVYSRANAVAMSKIFPNSGIVTLNEYRVSLGSALPPAVPLRLQRRRRRAVSMVGQSSGNANNATRNEFLQR